MHAVETAYGGRRFRGKSAKMRCQLEWTVLLRESSKFGSGEVMPFDRYKRNNDKQRGLQDNSETCEVAGFGAQRALVAMENVEDAERCREMAARKDCHPNWRRVLLELYVPWLAAHPLKSLTRAVRHRLVECLSIGADRDAGRLENNRPLGPAQSIERERAYYGEANRQRDAKRAHWMNDRSLLPLKPPGR